MLAPVVPTNQLFLAIQHHRNGDIQSLLMTSGYVPNQLSDTGTTAVHIACRYNNRFALDVLIGAGADPMFVDSVGNTPLHIAAKYGHYELCRYLIDRGSRVQARNQARQTPYDLAEDHTVRQYLLPLQLQAEREAGEVADAAFATHGVYGENVYNNPYAMPNQYGYAIHNDNYTPNTNLPPPPTMSFVPPTAPAVVPTAAAVPTAVAPFAPAPFANHPSASDQTSPPMSTTGTSVQRSLPTSGNRGIVPDGFHSSASDPVLQQKYGHVIEKPNIAPPPTINPSSTSPPTYQANPYAQSSYGYNQSYPRYVPYDTGATVARPAQLSQPAAAGYPPQYPYPGSSAQAPPRASAPPRPTLQLRSNALPTHHVPSPNPSPTSKTDRLLGMKTINNSDFPHPPSTLQQNGQSGSIYNFSSSLSSSEVINAGPQSNAIL